MKTTTIKHFAVGLVISSFLLTAPAFAASTTTISSVHINHNGVVEVVNAEVTGISGNVIQAVTHFRNSVMNWTFTTNASTTVAANALVTGNSSDIHIGDTLHVKGQVSNLASSTVVTATRIQDVSSMQSWKVKEGVVESINASSNSFVLKTGHKRITVAGNASTTIMQSYASSTLSIPTLPLNTHVLVHGRLSADGTSMLAAKILVLPTPSSTKKVSDDHLLHGLKLGWFFHGK